MVNINFNGISSINYAVINDRQSVSSQIGLFNRQTLVWRIAIGRYSTIFLIPIMYYIKHNSLHIFILNIIEISLIGITIVSSTENYPIGIQLESHYQIDLIEELHLLNTTYEGLSVEENFYPFSPTIFLSGDSRQIQLSSRVYQKAAYLISQSNEFTFIVSVKQNKQNTGSIISFVDGINRVLELQSSGRKDEIRLHYKHNNVVYTETFPYNIADEKWHKIALSVSDIHIDLFVDCNHIYKREIREIDMDLNKYTNVTLWLGQRNIKHFLYRGYLREVKLVTKSNGYLTQCPHLNSECPTCGQFKSLQNSVIKLENIIKKLNEKLYEIEKRMQNIEDCDCIKSCDVNGSIHPDGSTWKQNCDICSCVHGKVICRPIQCPKSVCKNPDTNPSECCPICKKTCFLNGQVLHHGEKIKISSKASNNGRCGECLCNDGKLTCKPIDVDLMCPILNCPLTQQFTKENECCKFCGGVDFCSAGNDCHSNASCYNLNAEYKCSCNSGFKGDGKYCEDINECLHEDSHHCRRNSKCVNLSGSYKCKCLGGYTRLDKFNCIDIDECSTKQNECDENAICINTPATYKCRCKPDYEGDGMNCKPICKHSCLNGGSCVAPNTCSCRTGFFGQYCEIDIDECALGLHKCDSNSRCVNKPGWYYCECRQGYRQTLINSANQLITQCRDIDECSTGLHSCHSTASCRNKEGGYYCSCDSDDTPKLNCSLNCIHNNVEHSDGETWKSDESVCKKCSCKKGVVSCKKKTCDCDLAIDKSDTICCPQCDIDSRQCHNQQDNSIVYRTGQTWLYDCQVCECMFGEIDCWDMECPPINCLNPIRKPGDCCPRCRDDPCDSMNGQNSTKTDLWRSGCMHFGRNYRTELDSHDNPDNSDNLHNYVN